MSLLVNDVGADNTQKISPQSIGLTTVKLIFRDNQLELVIRVSNTPLMHRDMKPACISSSGATNCYAIEKNVLHFVIGKHNSNWLFKSMEFSRSDCRASEKEFHE